MNLHLQRSCGDHVQVRLGKFMIGLYLVLIFQFLGVASVFAAEPVDTKLQPTSNQGMVLIPGGEFMMGSDKALSRPDEQPAHQVKVDIRWFRCLGLTQWLMQNGLANACRQKLNGNLHREEG